VAGTLDIHAMHRANMAPLAAFSVEQLQAWREAFALAMQAQLPPGMCALVERHRAEGDLCAIVTATSRWVAEPFARGFGIEHLVATEAVMSQGRPGTEIDGLPCFREHKVTKVEAWLSALGAPPLAAAQASWFYSDSASDLPLLQAVHHPVAVRPDARLRAHARAAGWPVLDTV
jgi:HAD superfamily hydrolase (TIGR01490 family)